MRLRLVGLLVIAAVVLSSCGSPRMRNASWDATDGFDEALWSIVDPSTTSGGALRVATTRDCGDWDPALAAGGTCRNLQRLVNRQLTAFGAGHGRRSAIAVPDLAVSRGSANADRTRWTYQLRPGVLWSDGTEVSVEQVADGIRWLGRRVPGVDIRSVATADDGRLEIVLGAPVGDLDAVVALPQAAPRRGGDRAFTGPFMVDGDSSDASVLVRNPHWDASTDPVRRPLVERVEITRVPTAAAAMGLLENGSVDLVTDGTLDAEVAQRILTQPSVAEIADNPGTGAVVMLALPGYGNAVWQQQECRQAVFSAVDRLAIVDVYGEGLPLPAFAARAATTLSAPTIASFDWSFEPFNVGDRSGDVTAALTRIDACAPAAPLVATLAVPKTVEAEAVAEAVRESVGRAGIEVEVQPVPLSEWVGLTTSPSRLAKRGIDWVLMQRSAAIPGVWGYWYPLVSGDLVGREPSTNIAQVDLPAVEVLLDSDATASDDSIRLDTLGRTVDRLVLESARYIPLVYRRMLLLRPDPIVNVTVNGGLGNEYDLVNIGVLP